MNALIRDLELFQNQLNRDGPLPHVWNRFGDGTESNELDASRQSNLLPIQFKKKGGLGLGNVTTYDFEGIRIQHNRFRQEH